MVMKIFKYENEELANSTVPALDFCEMTGLWTICSLKEVLWLDPCWANTHD